MTENRFKKGYCCGDTGLIDNEKEEWFVENINSISDLERNWNDALDKLNEVADENKKLKSDNNRLVNETARIVAEHQGRVLELIDEKIDKCEPIDYARNIEGDVPVFDCETATEIRVLNELKMELEDD